MFGPSWQVVGNLGFKSYPGRLAGRNAEKTFFPPESDPWESGNEAVFRCSGVPGSYNMGVSVLRVDVFFSPQTTISLGFPKTVCGWFWGMPRY